MWLDFPAQLAQQLQRPVIVYSRTGYGTSDPCKLPRSIDYMHDEGLCVLPELLHVLGCQQPFLLGHSDGGSIALLAASTLPVQGLILFAPHLFAEDLTVTSITQARHQYLTTDLPQRLSKYHQDADHTFWGWSDIWLDPAFRQWNIEQHIKSIRAPMLVIQGVDDQYGSMQQVDTIKQHCAQTQLLKLPHCGHSPHKDQPAAVLQAVSNFINAIQETTNNN